MKPRSHDPLEVWLCEQLDRSLGHKIRRAPDGRSSTDPEPNGQAVRIGSRLTTCTIATRTIAPIKATMNEMIRPVGWTPKISEKTKPPTNEPTMPRTTSQMIP